MIEHKQEWLLNHLNNIYAFYGEVQGVKIARKHMNWQLGLNVGYRTVRPALMQATCSNSQIKTIEEYFEHMLPESLAKAS